MVYPLLVLGVIAIAIIIDRAVSSTPMPATAGVAGRPGRDLRIFVGGTRKAA